MGSWFSRGLPSSRISQCGVRQIIVTLRCDILFGCLLFDGSSFNDASVIQQFLLILQQKTSYNFRSFCRNVFIFCSAFPMPKIRTPPKKFPAYFFYDETFSLKLLNVEFQSIIKKTQKKTPRLCSKPLLFVGRLCHSPALMFTKMWQRQEDTRLCVLRHKKSMEHKI